MERYNLAELTKKIYNSGFAFFTLKTLSDILEIKKQSTLFNIIERLIKGGIFLKIEKNKYLLKDAQISDFSLANYLYSPSYISFESALNFYGILSQFPYEITSATIRKTTQKIFLKKIFTFTHIKENLFFGYQKKEDFIIAYPEKAILDQLYLFAKGYKKVNLDEYNLDIINNLRLKDYLKKYPSTKQFEKVIKNFKKYIKL